MWRPEMSQAPETVCQQCLNSPEISRAGSRLSRHSNRSILQKRHNKQPLMCRSVARSRDHGWRSRVSEQTGIRTHPRHRGGGEVRQQISHLPIAARNKAALVKFSLNRRKISAPHCFLILIISLRMRFSRRSRSFAWMKLKSSFDTTSISRFAMSIQPTYITACVTLGLPAPSDRRYVSGGYAGKRSGKCRRM